MTDFNSLAPGKFEWNFIYVIFKPILVIDGWGISFEIAIILMSPDFTNNQSTLVQVMAWYCQTTSHYLSQCWPRSLSLYGVTRPEWVNGDSGRWICQISPIHMYYPVCDSTLQNLMLKPTGHWMDCHLHLLIHCIIWWGQGWSDRCSAC